MRLLVALQEVSPQALLRGVELLELFVDGPYALSELFIWTNYDSRGLWSFFLPSDLPNLSKILQDHKVRFLLSVPVRLVPFNTYRF